MTQPGGTWSSWDVALWAAERARVRAALAGARSPRARAHLERRLWRIERFLAAMRRLGLGVPPDPPEEQGRA